jgi:hypothetical protein
LAVVAVGALIHQISASRRPPPAVRLTARVKLSDVLKTTDVTVTVRTVGMTNRLSPPEIVTDCVTLDRVVPPTASQFVVSTVKTGAAAWTPAAHSRAKTRAVRNRIIRSPYSRPWRRPSS